MSMRKKPYIAFYTQDFATDERLMECSAMATGVYIRLICLLHQSEHYGCITLRPKDHLDKEDVSELLKQISRKTNAKTRKKIAEIEQKTLEFSQKIQRNMPYSLQEIALGLHELLSENVLQIDGETLYQKRMIRDNELSEKRSKAGTYGMESRYQQEEVEAEIQDEFCYNKRPNKPLTNDLTNTNNNIQFHFQEEREKENILKEKEKERQPSISHSRTFTKPSLEEVTAYCAQRANGIDPQKFIDFYEANGWVQGRQGKPIRDWKACIRTWEHTDITTTLHEQQLNTTGTAPTVRGTVAKAKTRHTTL